MMLENLFAQASQSRTFLMVCLLGMLAGALSDLSKGLGRLHPLLGWLGDALSALIIAVGVLGALLMGQSGMRLYVALGLVTGAALYHAGLRPVIAWLARRIQKFFPQAGNRRGGDESIRNSL